VAGLQSEGVSAVAKHFPGHGDTETDSHFETPILNHDRTRLDAVELKPFKMVAENGIDAMMTAHIVLPKVAEKADLPATISKNLLTGIVRDEWHYQGLVITDGLEMHGIVSRYGSGEAAVRAIQAGADMVLILWTVEKKNEVHRALLKAVKEGRISQQRLNESLTRILNVKKRRGILNHKLLPVAQTLKALKKGKHRQVVKVIAEKAVTVVSNPNQILPLSKNKTILIASTEPTFMKKIQGAIPNTRSVRLRLGASAKRKSTLAKQVVASAENADIFVLGILNNDYARLARDVRNAYPNKPIVVVSFGSPFIKGFLPKNIGYVCAFGFRRDSEIASAEVLLGMRQAEGLLPVTLDEPL
jgi:beta-N-acetylhexosaminidase